jgi:hypothetical protein
VKLRARMPYKRFHDTGKMSRYPLASRQRERGRPVERRTRTIREVVKRGRDSRDSLSTKLGQPQKAPGLEKAMRLSVLMGFNRIDRPIPGSLIYK